MGTPAETVDVPAGEFWMGCNDAVDDQCNPFEDNEDPYHQVTLAAYKIYKYEVTASEYKACVDAGACSVPSTDGDGSTYDVAGKENHPVNGTDWNQASTFCAWVGGSLPSEAQWEKAARGYDGLKYPWGDTPAVSCDLAVVPDGDGVDGCGTGETMPVGSKPDGVSPCGAMDMIGSVWEWVADYYAMDYYESSPSTDPTGPATGEDRVIRGGSWAMPDPAFLRASMRQRNEPGFQSDSHGFRCVLPAN
jgi:formylglycine-generating enzyme required for sulfatase activity